MLLARAGHRDRAKGLEEGINMSKTWKEEHRKHRAKSTEPTPEKAIDRLRMEEAENEIREALAAPQEATNAAQ